MKIILSRKGFDSGYGGVASPVMPDDRMVSLPIPHPAAPYRYADLAWDGVNLGSLVSSLTNGVIGASHQAHFDPDLRHDALPRRAGWRPAFGQISAAQSHLANCGVGVGDLFLFFGWFRSAEPDGTNGWRYVRNSPDIHAVFGWLQVGWVLDVGNRHAEHKRLRPWLADHPHLNAHGEPGNTVYVASDRLVIGGQDMGAPGGGVFKNFHNGLRLTGLGQTRANWDLPGWLLPDLGPTLSYHRDPRRWSRLKGGRCALRSVSQGQEFVMDCVDRLAEATGWIAALRAGPECQGAANGGNLQPHNASRDLARPKRVACPTVS